MATLGAEIRRIVENYRYAYPSARARAMKSLLLTDEQKKKTLEAQDLQGALYILRETLYGPVLKSAKNILAVELALRKDLAETLQKVNHFLPGRAQSIFKLYLTRFEAENIKSVLVGIKAKTSKKIILQMVVPIYVNLDKGNYENMASSKTIEEAISALSETIYHETLMRGYKDYKSSNLLTPMEVTLDSMVYERIFSRISTSTGSDVDSLKKMIGIEIDITNLKSILRLRGERTTPADTMKYLIPRGYQLNRELLGKLSRAVDVEEMLLRLEKTYYKDPLSRGYKLFEASKREKLLSTLERSLDDFIVEVGRSFEKDFPLGIGPILGYVIAKKGEVRRLITILKLKEEGFTGDEIEEVVGKL
jgi:V/A-type H+-transporting ATPase subunit C